MRRSRATSNVLLVAQPSSLTQKQIDNLTDYIKKGGATLLFLDPFPVENPSISPELPKMPPGGPFGGGQPPEPKGNLRPLLDLVGIDWPSSEIVWNVYNPHPKLAEPAARDRLHRQGQRRRRCVQRRADRQRRAFRRSSRSSPACSAPRPAGPGPSSSRCCGPADRAARSLWSEVAQQSFMGFGGINPRRRHIPTGESYTLAARHHRPGPGRRRAGRARQEGRREEEGREAGDAGRRST